MNPNIQKQIKTLDSGLRICAISNPAIKTVSLRCLVFVGSIYETPDKNGISHFLEHMLFRGNRKLGNANQVSLKMEELGGELNAATAFDLTEFWLDFHIDYLFQGIDRFCQFLKYPAFENIELERSIILEEIRADYNEKNLLVDIDTIIALEQWPNHPMGLPVVGNETSVGRITVDDLTDWYHEFYRPGNMLISIIGDFNTDQVFNRIFTHFADSPFSEKKAYPPMTSNHPVGNQIKLTYEKDNQFRIQWAFNTHPLTQRLRINYQLIRRILDDGSSSRLQRFIREEKGLVYDISADMLYFNSGVSFSIQCLVSKNRLIPLVSALTGLVNRLQSEGVTPAELELAKRRYRISLECNVDTAHGVLFETIAPLAYPEVMPIDRVLKSLPTVELAEVNQTLAKLFNQTQSCFALVGPWEKKEEQELSRLLSNWINS